jgi:hypothetical protein
MQEPVHIIANSRQEKLDSASRINYAKIYTIDHNLKAYDFGEVDSSYYERFIDQYDAVQDELKIKARRARRSSTSKSQHAERQVSFASESE